MKTDFDLPLAPRRGRPPQRKTRITIYLDDEVLNEFRSRAERTGTGYQTLINAALRVQASEPDGSVPDGAQQHFAARQPAAERNG